MDTEAFREEVRQVEQEYYRQAPDWILKLNSEIRKAFVKQSYYVAQSHPGTTTSQISVLEYLLRNGGCAPVGGMSSEFFYTKQALSSTLNTMEAKGLIERITDPQDKRKRMLQLTEAGLQRIRDILVAREESLGRVVALLSQEEAEEAARVLEKLNDFYTRQLPRR